MRAGIIRLLLITIGAAAATFVLRWRAPSEPARYEDRTAPANRASGGGVGLVERADDDRQRRDLEHRIELLAATVAQETAELLRLEARLEVVAAQLAARGRGSDETATSSSEGDAAASDAPDTAAVDDSLSAMEHALVAAGIDAATAADIKRRSDELAMREMYLRDRAVREQWLDSPRFAEEMAAIEAQRTSIRDEIGDAAYDRYLFAQGERNRVRIEDVLSESPAARAGLQTGDMILRYGDTRIFSPDELVAETRGGTVGEAIRLDIIRNGERVEVEVPRGPLGLRIAATQSEPTS